MANRLLPYNFSASIVLEDTEMLLEATGGIPMAKVIEFYIPVTFHKVEKLGIRGRGRVIQFALPRKKSA